MDICQFPDVIETGHREIASFIGVHRKCCGCSFRNKPINYIIDREARVKI